MLIGHSGVSRVTAAGQVGVTVFFTLSGFLITSILLDERDRRGQISLTRFYARRARRLLPALSQFLAAMSLLAVLWPTSAAPSVVDVLGAIFYVGNFTTALQAHDTVITHTWSLAVEEQFYIVWPPLLVGMLRLRRTAPQAVQVVALAASAFAVIERVVLWHHGLGALRVYVCTDTRMDGLLVGCLAAMWLRGRSATAQGHGSGRMADLLLLCAAGLMFTRGAGAMLVAPSLVPWLTAAAIVRLVRRPYSGLLQNRALSLIGRRSYGLYLWHYPLWAAASHLAGPMRLTGLCVAALLSAGLVRLSWRCVEEPFLRGQLTPDDRPDERGGPASGPAAGLRGEAGGALRDR